MKIGILGFAHGHVGMYMTRWRDNPNMGIEVVCGWDHNPDRLQKSAEKFGFDPVVDAGALLARDQVEGVVIAAETSRHANLAVKAAEAGKAIILQKPMSLTMGEADRIVAAVEESGVPFTMAWQMRVDPQNQKIKEILEKGTLGRVFSVRRRHGLPMCLRDDFADSWHVDPRQNRDMWADDSAHPIDFVNWLFGVPESVTAEILSLHNPRMPMDNGVALFRYPEGPLVEVSCSFTNRAAENVTEIICEKGSLIQNYGDVPSCNVPRPDDAVGLKWFLQDDNSWTYSDIPTPKGHGERIGDLAGPLADFLNGKRDPIATATEGRDSLRMVLACYVSTREGRRVSLNDEAVANV